jgi:hypothetical protein
MIEYEFKFTFIASDEGTPRADFKREDVNRVLVPFLFPRSRNEATYVGSTVLRVDHVRTLSTRSDTVSDPP